MSSFEEWFNKTYEPDIMWNRKFVYDLSGAAYNAGIESGEAEGYERGYQDGEQGDYKP